MSYLEFHKCFWRMRYHHHDHHKHYWLSPVIRYSECEGFKASVETGNNVWRHARGHDKGFGILYYNAAFYSQWPLWNTEPNIVQSFEIHFSDVVSGENQQIKEVRGAQKPWNKLPWPLYYCLFSIIIGFRTAYSLETIHSITVNWNKKLGRNLQLRKTLFCLTIIYLKVIKKVLWGVISVCTTAHMFLARK
jgi:hypothetical protein